MTLFHRHAWLSTTLLFAIGGCALDTDETESVDEQDIISGQATNLRPEIGSLAFPTGGGLANICTGTLVDTRWVLTAAHCVNYTNVNAPAGSVFTITRTDGTTVSLPYDKTFVLARGTGEADIALLRMKTAVAATDAKPTTIASTWPATGTRQTVFGFGCQDRGTRAGGGFKQFFEFLAGQVTHNLCPGDSGGPVVWNGLADNGPVFAVNSATSGSDGSDIFANASFYAIPALEAVKRLSDAFAMNPTNPTLAGWAATPGVKAVSGDFNGDGLGDFALVGGTGWTTAPIAWGNGTGTFSWTNAGLPDDTAAWTRAAIQAVAGDFDHDGRTDIALFGGPGWTTIPVLYSRGDGTFRYTNQASGDFGTYARALGAQVVAGDFNNDRIDDLAIVGGIGWGSIAVAMSRGDGFFNVTNNTDPNIAAFAGWAQSGLGSWSRQVQAVAGDFDGDGDADIALVGGSGWTTIPVAFSDRFGGFTIRNNGVAHFPQWAASGWSNGVKAVAGDFDSDGKTDIALAGAAGWMTIALAFSQGGGNFTAGNLPINNFADYAHDARFLLSGPFRDRRRRLLLTRDLRIDLVGLGNGGWTTVPVAFLRN